MPIDYRLYPADWPAIRARILLRAGNRCEGCGLPNGALGVRLPDGAFVETPDHAAGTWVGGRKVMRVVLTVAHLNHDTADNRDENLRAWCQQCHNRHDAKMRAERRRAKDAAQRAVSDLSPNT